MGGRGRGVHHSSASAEYYTPEPYLEGARFVMGGIDLDPASCARAQELVRAARYYDRRENGLVRPWGGRVWLNPPGDPRGQNIVAFWRRAVAHAASMPEAVVLWAGFNLSSAPRLEATGLLDGRPCPGPTAYPRVTIGPEGPCTKGGRICWLFGRRLRPAEQPGHPSYFCLLGGDAGQRARFRARFGAWGAYQSPTPPRRDVRAEVRDLMQRALAQGRTPDRELVVREVAGRRIDVLRAYREVLAERHPHGAFRGPAIGALRGVELRRRPVHVEPWNELCPRGQE